MLVENRLEHKLSASILPSHTASFTVHLTMCKTETLFRQDACVCRARMMKSGMGCWTEISSSIERQNCWLLLPGIRQTSRRPLKAPLSARLSSLLVQIILARALRNSCALHAQHLCPSQLTSFAQSGHQVETQPFHELPERSDSAIQKAQRPLKPHCCIHLVWMTV